MKEKYNYFKFFATITLKSKTTMKCIRYHHHEHIWYLLNIFYMTDTGVNAFWHFIICFLHHLCEASTNILMYI